LPGLECIIIIFKVSLVNQMDENEFVDRIRAEYEVVVRVNKLDIALLLPYRACLEVELVLRGGQKH
jgi:hypothetical protein